MKVSFDSWAHSADVAGSHVEWELLVFGIALMGLAFVFRPSQSGNGRAAVVTLVVGVALILGAFLLPAS